MTELASESVSVVELLSRLRAADVELWVEGDRLRFSAPPGAMTPELRAAVGAHKAAVMNLVRRAASTAAAGAPGAAPITPVPRDGADGALPLSYQQRRMWFFEQVHPGTATYHMATSWRLRGALDTRALASAFAAIVRRHEVLRSAFGLRGDEPVQTVLADLEVPLPVLDLSGLPAADRAAELRRLTAADSTRPFHLGRPPLLRTTLLRTGETEHVLRLTVHHIVADMWSADVLLHELMACYTAGTGGEPARLPELPVQYADVAAWQRARTDDEGTTDLGYWSEQLRGAPAFLDLPADRPRPPVATYAGAQRSAVLDADLVARLDALCRRTGTTRFMALLASFATLLHRYCGEDDIVIGSPIAHRTHRETENLIGFFVNTLALRCDLSGGPTFTALLDRVRDTALGAYEHQSLPVERLVEALNPRREPGRSPLFQVMLTLQNSALAPLRLPGLTVEELADDRTATEFDLTLELDDHGPEIVANLQFNADIFGADSITRMLGNWRTLLRAVTENPDRPLGALPMLTDAERTLLIEGWNRTEAAYPRTPVHEVIAARAARTPDASAVVFRDREVGYAELDRAATALAARLHALEAAGQRPVAVCVPRSPEMIISLLAVLKAGAPYLPLDPATPPDRLAHVLDDADVRLVVTTSARAATFAPHDVRTVLVDGPDEAAPPDVALVPEPDGATGADDIAYVIYTSGSTGKPKGVQVRHAGLSNFLAAMDDVLGVEPGGEPGTWLAVTSVSFDIAVLELLWPLAHGWRVVVQDEGDVLPGDANRSPRSSRTLDFSLFYFAVDDEADAADRYRLLLDGARFADRNGFSGVWTPERHFDAFGGLYPNPAVTGAALAAVTERLQLRAGSVVLPLHHPIRVAEEWAVVDNLSGGRVSVSFASGWHADDFALAPQPDVYGRRKAALPEQIDTVRRLWRGERVAVTNGVGREIEVATHPRPVQPELPFWLTAAGDPATFRTAGATGANLLTHLLGQSVDELAEKIAAYRQARRAAGHPGEGTVALMVHTFVGTDSALVKDTVRSPFRAYLRRSFGLVRALAPSLGIDGEPSPEDVEALLDHAFEGYSSGSALLGTVDECVAMAERLREIGIDEVACLIDFGVPTDAVLDSLPLLDEVRRRCATPTDDSPADFAVAAQIERYGVTHLQCTPSLAGILLADPRTRRALRSVDTLVVGGEALTPALAGELTQLAAGRVVNMYGPTETTIWSTAWPVEDPARGVSIGRPLANTQTYVVDGNLEPVPVGVPGELCIGGHGLARGYLNRPELTAQRFPPSPFVPGARLYRTGDRARHLPDGRIEFLGRLDRQVKLGGHRIELGEIESVLAGQPDVRQAAVVVHGDVGPGRLVAYLVAAGARAQPAELRARLRRTLPEVMIPSELVWLDELPRNTSGKVDHRALPAPDTVAERDRRADRGMRAGYVAPRDAIEGALAEIWRDVLKVDQVGVEDTFFELGGHSLMAIQMVSRLRAAFGKDITLRTVFESSTVALLARRVREAATSGTEGAVGGTAPETVRAVPRTGPVPLSFAQARVWFFEQLNPGVVAYHLSAAFRLRGGLSLDALRRAFTEIVRRHEILRTVFTVADEQPAQVVMAPPAVPLPCVDLSGLAGADREAEVVRLAVDESRVPFDLETDTLLRTTILRLGPGEHVLLLTTHHIAADSWSIAVLAGELRALYEAYVAGRPSPLPELAVQYADFAVWQRDRLRGPLLQRQLAYWRETLDGAPELMTLPYDRPRPETARHDGAQATFTLSGDLSDRLKELSLTNEVTVFVTLLAAFCALLHRWAGHEHIVLGVPVAGRDLPELEPLVGFLGNATVLHNDLSGDPRFTEVLRRVRQVVIGAYDHQDLPVEKLVADLDVARDARHNPLFQVMFVYINDLAMAPDFGGLEIAPLDVHSGSVFMDLNMAMEDSPDGLRGTLDYDTDLFDASTIDRLLAGFRSLLDAVVAQPDMPIGALPPAPAPATEPATEPVAEPAPVPEPQPQPQPQPVADPDPGAEPDPAAEDAVPVVISATFTAQPVRDALEFWLDRVLLPADIRFAPYDQVFQQLLDPASALAAHPDGVGVVLLHAKAWGEAPAEIADEFADAVRAFHRGRSVPLVVVLCPPTGPRDDLWRAALTSALSGVDGVLCLDMVPRLASYDVGDPHDPVSEEAGDIPYTPEFFAALGTCLARQVAAVVTEYPRVVVLDRSRTPLDEGPAEMLTGVAAALAAQGRAVFDVRAARSPRDQVAAALRQTGSTPEDCLFLSADDAACAAVAADHPGVVVHRYPPDEDGLATFLAHTWLFDPPDRETPTGPWWKGERR